MHYTLLWLSVHLTISETQISKTTVLRTYRTNSNHSNYPKKTE